ncbi:hypothetical protein GCM10008959_26370 [Deinococcus seoulensis]|uniref:DUF4157 domain-containing protein n=1 Tax=Deinococcus seoulensis TaxID=1837379 RepID=A0ABQ2RSP0_9DEIO|nr:hypothetical protein [Deinococcus seoulensis]GGR63000.1 hypothetical protein GCM10008959_26370 [Deinococcus seoulensis]
MLRFLPLLALLLAGCGLLVPPVSPLRAWGVPFMAEVVPAGALAPFQGFATAYHVRVEAPYTADVFLVAHELAHVWQWHHRNLMRDWAGVPCAVQVPGHCTPREAHADAVALAVLAAGCLPGDLGWPGGAVSGCVLPDPASIRPP